MNFNFEPQGATSYRHKVDRIKSNLTNFIRNKTVNIDLLKLTINSEELNSIDPCEFYHPKEIAENTIDRILNNAVHKVNNTFKQRSIPQVYVKEEKFIKIYEWPTIDAFTNETNEKNIEKNISCLIKKYVNSWELHPIFRYTINYLGSFKEELSKFFRSEVLFSTPIPQCPCPLFTASVYFTIETSHVVPKSLPIHVTYQFEGFDKIEIADHRFQFQQKILQTILNKKMNVLKDIKF